MRSFIHVALITAAVLALGGLAVADEQPEATAAETP